MIIIVRCFKMFCYCTLKSFLIHQASFVLNISVKFLKILLNLLYQLTLNLFVSNALLLQRIKKVDSQKKEVNIICCKALLVTTR